MAPSLEAIGQLTPTNRRQRTTTPTVPKPKSRPIDDGKDGPSLRGARFSSAHFEHLKIVEQLANRFNP
jgi:hypothetical protein